MVKQNRVQYSATKKKSAGSVKQSPTTSNTPPSNQPRNLLVTDATQPFALSFKGRYGLTTTIEVHQTPDEETWPGGALWDLGVLLAEVMIALALKAPVEVTTTVTTNDGRRSSARKTIQPPKRLVDTLQGDSFVDRALHKPCILELGAGVGLTGIVAASAMNASLALLTDLAVVVEGVTRGNVERNATVTRGSRMLTMQKGQVKIAAVPLCWGCTKDENAVRDMIEELDTPCRSAPVSRRKKKGTQPGAPSHFDVLVSTLLQLTTETTLVVFGTRIRMPASVDLLYMILEHFEPVIEPLSGEEVDQSLAGIKHNMSIHFLRRKSVE